MADFIVEQEETRRLINKVMPNFKKAGKAKRTAVLVASRQLLLNAHWEDFRITHRKIIVHQPSEAEAAQVEAYKTEDVYSAVEAEYLEASDYFVELAASMNPVAIKSGQSDQTNQPSSIPNPVPFKLPPIVIPKFNGDVLKWMSFRDLFESLVHNNQTLTDVQRLHYLKGNLEGDASKELSQVEITAANYASSWEHLKDRYTNERLIVMTYLEAYSKIPAVKQESAIDLKQLLDSSTEIIRALRNLKREVDTWDDWLVFTTSEKLDATTRKDWETSLRASKDMPTFKELETFVEGRIHTLLAINRSNPTKSQLTRSSPRSSPKTHNLTITPHATKCKFCEASHHIYSCPGFLKLTPTARMQIANDSKLCTNCFHPNHVADACSSKFRCRTCKGLHNTLLHIELNSNSSAYMPKSSVLKLPDSTCNPITSEPSVSTHSFVHSQQTCDKSNCVLLATAWVSLESTSGQQVSCRALLDQGSEASFLSESIAQLLHLQRIKIKTNLVGVGMKDMGCSNGIVNFRLKSHVNPQFSLDVDAFVLPKVTGVLPSKSLPIHDWPHIHGLELADEDFYKTNKIDLLLGAEVFAELLIEGAGGVKRGLQGTPVAQNTQLGWILSGHVYTQKSPHNQNATQRIQIHHNAVDTDILLRRFWEIEDISTKREHTAEDESCERHYVAHHSRNAEGRYSVGLPFKSDVVALGSTLATAMKRLRHQENRQQINPALAIEYSKFLMEYAELGHMQLIPANEINRDAYYLPHHAILKLSSTTTKLRVVFDASQRSSNGSSLNDVLHTGPSLQQDLSEVITRWRTHRIAFSADIEKMYRQIDINESDRDWQRIIWRKHPSDELSHYKLSTLTYGTSCAPFLAIRTLHQLATDEGARFPLASAIAKRDFYMDDLLSGAENDTDAKHLQHETITMLKAGGFNLRKWVSNSSSIISDLPAEHVELPSSHIGSQSIKTLGIYWIPASDEFEYRLVIQDLDKKPTKRTMLSDIARLFDPLGWLSPVIIAAKIQMQNVWATGKDWDDELSDPILSKWLTLRSGLTELNHIRIPRWIASTTTTTSQLHGFADASGSAYAAIVYLRVEDSAGQIHVNIIQTKTKVAPIKKITIPRLELCAASLLAKLTLKIQANLNLDSHNTYLWTDSMIVLDWLRGDQRKWPTFVSNRVHEILTNFHSSQWYHIRTDQNPADCASRGITPKELLLKELYWHGPPFLLQPQQQWPTQSKHPSSSIETNEPTENTVQTNTCKPATEPWAILGKYSSLTRLTRVTAYVLRFTFNTRTPKTRRDGPLEPDELERAKTFWIHEVQKTSFPHWSLVLKSYVRLNPFIDSNNTIRIGGRLSNSTLPYNQKHPILLPKHSHLSDLIVREAHHKCLHGGTQITLNYLRQSYWLISARNKVRLTIRNCIVCTRQAAVTRSQLMGDLPSTRITPSRPFQHTGVDFAGPIHVRTRGGRGHQSHKAYISIFVCFSTKAVHIELVSDLSTAAFLAAFRRFCARRGLCQQMYSDNATNFVGADAELRKFFHNSRNELRELLSSDGTTWSFIPPSSPHFGGLWEAAVKSTKHHLRRVIGTATLTFEEMTTLLAQIEAVLNSRPLYPLNDGDPETLSVLTPGHFLIGTALLAIPETSLLSVQDNRLTRWNQVQKMVQQFWSQWSVEYLNHLQIRNKWMKAEKNINVNDIVLMKDENSPPTKWPLALVRETHKGSDGQIRVVTVLSHGKLLKRAITKLVLLPVHT